MEVMYGLLWGSFGLLGPTPVGGSYGACSGARGGLVRGSGEALVGLVVGLLRGSCGGSCKARGGYCGAHGAHLRCARPSPALRYERYNFYEHEVEARLQRRWLLHAAKTLLPEGESTPHGLPITGCPGSSRS